MVLYEDLRVYTIWRTQMAQYRAQSMQYKKSAEEWEILGSLAERLHHTEESVEAYRACLSQRFSPKALTGILKVFERDIRLLGLSVRVLSSTSGSGLSARSGEDDALSWPFIMLTLDGIPKPIEG